MKPLYLLALFLSVFFFRPIILWAESDSAKLVYVFEIKQEIAPAAARNTKIAIDKAHEAKADIILLRLNTYGGMVDAADSIRIKILDSKIPVYIWIEDNAASAGALISIACDSIYMKPGSTIGAATVVNQTGEVVPDKYQSYMRSKMRATAERTGRNPDIAEAMVDPDKYIPGIVDSGKVLTFTTSEAIKNGFCNAEAVSMEEVMKKAGIGEYRFQFHEETWIDKVISLLINPVVSGILIMLIIGGIYYELQTPGIGFPLIAAIVGAVFYFMPLYLEGLAEHWEILLFIAGLVLIVLEIFVIPGFGVAGVSGIILLMAGLTLSLVGNIGFDFEPVSGDSVVKSLFTVILSCVLSLTLSVFFGMKLLHATFFRKFILETTQEKEKGFIGTDLNERLLIGKSGLAHTILRPSGKVQIEGEIYDATAETGFIEKGEKITVIRYEASQLFVRRSA